MNSYEKFKREFLIDVARPGMGEERHFRSFELANKYGIPDAHVRELVVQWAKQALLRLRAWDGERVLEWHEWRPNPDAMFLNTDGGYVRVKILAAGAALIEDLPKHPIGFATTHV